jgi:hypothetical protein
MSDEPKDNLPPHPAEVDFDKYVTELMETFLKELPPPSEQTPEYWLSLAASRLHRLASMNTPKVILEQARRLLLSRLLDIPVYDPDYEKSYVADSFMIMAPDLVKLYRDRYSAEPIDVPGTMACRFKGFLAQLEERFPDAVQPTGDPPERQLLEAIDRLLEDYGLPPP